LDNLITVKLLFPAAASLV